MLIKVTATIVMEVSDYLNGLLKAGREDGFDALELELKVKTGAASVHVEDIDAVKETR